METGFIPPNLHYSKPRKGVEALESGKLKVVTEVVPFKTNSGMIAIGSFGFGGVNSHCVLKWNEKKKLQNGLPLDDIPRLVCYSGRTEQAIHSIANDLKSRTLDAEFVGLLHNVFKYDTRRHRNRGYSIISKQGEICRSQKEYHQEKTHFYIVFGNIETCKSFRKELIQLPIFSDTISSIENKILGLLTSDDIKKNIVSTVITQIAILEVLKHVGVEPCDTFGVSDGEFANSYVRGDTTMEQAIVLAYCEGKRLNPESKVIKNTAIAINNIINNVNSKNVVAVNEDLVECYPNKVLLPKKTTDSFWNIDDKSVLMEIGNIHKNMETAAQQNGKKFVRLPCEGIVSLLEALGRLYELGWNPDLGNLYPEVKFPVSRGTPMISPLIKWEHEKDWFVLKFTDDEQPRTYEHKTIISLKKKEWKYLAGHIVDGNNTFPTAGYLYIVWDAFCKIDCKVLDCTKVVFENVKFKKTITIVKNGCIEFNTSFHRSNGYFEVLENKVLVVSGKIKELREVANHISEVQFISNSDPQFSLKEEDIYKELRLRGYNYTGLFRGVKQYNANTTTGLVEWNENWVTFMENMIQIRFLNINSRNLYIPISIERMTIDSQLHATFCKNKEFLPAHFVPICGVLRSGGIEVKGLSSSSIIRTKSLGEPVLEKYIFVSNEVFLTTEQSLRVNVQIMVENNYKIKAKIVELIREDYKEDQEILAPFIFNALSDLPLVHADVTVLSAKPIELKNVTVVNKLTNLTGALLVVVNRALSTGNVLQKAFKILDKNGYILSREAATFDHSTRKIPSDIEILTVHTTPSEKLILLVKAKQYMPEKVLDISDKHHDFKWLIPLQTAAKNSEEGLVLLAHDDPMSGILGLVNCMRREPGEEKTRCIFLQTEAPDFNSHVYRNQLKKSFAINVYNNGSWGTYRHLLLNTDIESKSNCSVHLQRKSDLCSLKWIENPPENIYNLNPDEDIVYVYCSALNFKGVSTVTDKTEFNRSSAYAGQEITQGIEFSGRKSTGQRVMGINLTSAPATVAAIHKDAMIPVPDSWSLEDAATVPFIYGTVLYALLKRAAIQRGDSILIHAGSDSVGQAAINIAHYYGCEVFTTVDTEEKRNFIRKYFPTIKDSHIGSSSDISFEQLVFKKTKGRGVDIVFNSLPEEMLQTSMRCTVNGGTFLDVRVYNSHNIGINLYLNSLERNLKYHGVCLNRYLKRSSTAIHVIFNMLKEGICNGSVKPLTRTSFESDEIEKAYRTMTCSPPTAKVLIKVRKEEEELFAKPSTKLIQAASRYYCNPEGSYAIVGGLGGFGLELADWLVKRGARKLILSSRTGIRTGYQSYRIKSWTSDGIKVEICTASISTEAGCKTLLDQANSLGTVVGIFNLAVVLHDALLENQTDEMFRKLLMPKVKTTKLLDHLSRRMCPNLKDFVAFSSMSCGRGNAGQTNYGMANSVMERICENRKREGYPALAIQWGAVSDVGIVAEAQIKEKVLEMGGTLQHISSCLEVMDNFMTQNETIVSSIVVAEKQSPSGSADNIVDCVASIIGIRDIKTVSPEAPFHELGMDSLMRIEIKQTLEREFDVELTPQDIKTMTLARLHQIMFEKEGTKINRAESMQNVKCPG